MNKVLLTGAGGFVGHHTLSHLLKTTDWEFVVTDSFNHFGTSSRLRAVFEEIKDANKRVKVITHDLSAPIDSITAHEFGKINTIINMASGSHVDRSISHPRPFVENNIALALTMFDYARTLDDLKCFIQISTDEVYGPAPEGTFHKEWEPLIPSNPYSASKMGQEAIATAYWRSYGLPLVITNTMNIIGERQDVEKFVPKTVSSLLSGKKMTVHSRVEHGSIVTSGSRFYLHARNQADALRFLVEHFSKTPHCYYDGLSKPERFNVRGEVEIKNDEMVHLIADILGVDKNLSVDYVNVEGTRPGHDLRYALDGSRLESLGWKPPVPFEESLERTVLWTKNNPQWLK
jgi:dTDP-glucose 4,6-dehydratase